MHQTIRTTRERWRKAALTTLAAAMAWAVPARAEMPAEPPSLARAFDLAWAKQPESLALRDRREAALAQQRSSDSWVSEPATLELSNTSDRAHRNAGAREYEVGVAVPLWLPGERARAQAVAHAAHRAVESHSMGAQLRLAATVREAWWGWQRSRAEVVAARAQLGSARHIAADVGQRLKAGDLARADQHQAEGSVAAAESALAQAEAALIATQQQLQAITADPRFGAEPAQAMPVAEPEPEPDAAQGTHGELLALQDRTTVVDETAALAWVQSRANPELTIKTTRNRGAFGETYQQAFTLGVRIPFGGGPRHSARAANARAEAAEMQAQLALAQARLAHERDASRARVGAARAQLSAAERRAQLARESRGFFDKSFRLGETDLPTRLRIEAEATEAERQAARSRIELAAAISSWRQALGLLPQ